jgi:serine/threonine protein kinase/Tol biopolymer transport system component
VTLQAGTRLGTYEIIAPLGAGGMGEVYRARDTRIGREVAIKVLPQSVAEDSERLSRFDREARAAGALSHPNLLTIYELGMEDGSPYLVSELLDGSTLRDRLSGAALPPRKAIDYALQIADGLGAVHDKGIVHRDLKPENIFVTRDGRVKILDFGLAKVRAISQAGTEAPTAALETDPGTVVGTAGYMSPEQVRGERIDHRTDIFSLGAILYEMLSGKRAFHASSSIDTMHAILHADPPALSETNSQIPPSLERIVQHCLEKNPEERFQSARDLAFDLQTVSGASGSAPSISPLSARKSARRLLVAAAIAVAAVGGWFVGSRLNRRPVPRFHRLTFRSGNMSGARFVPGQQSILFSSQSGFDSDVFAVTPGRPEVRSLNMPRSQLLSVSRSGEMAILTNARFTGEFTTIGTLARVPMGGAPRELAEGILGAEWMPSRDELLIVRSAGGKTRLELPIGTVIYSTSGWISTPRLSPDGKSIAFIEHPISGDDAGFVYLLTADHKPHVLTRHFNSAQGLAWTPDGREIWFTAATTGGARVLNAVTLDGRERLLVSAPNVLTLFDISADGRLLLSQSNARIALLARGPGDGADRDLSWLDWSTVRHLSPDAQQLLFDETSEGGGENYSVYTRRIDGSPAVRLGDGTAHQFSSDGRSVLAIRIGPVPQIFAYPIGPGDTRQLTHDNIAHLTAAWTPDNRRIVFVGHEPNRGDRLYIQDVDGGHPRALTGEGIVSPSLQVSPDGRRVYARAGGRVTVFSLADGPPVVIPEIAENEEPVAWTPDGKAIVYFRRNVSPAPVFKIDIVSHRVEHWRDISGPFNPYGALGMVFSADGRTYAYSSFLTSSDLYLLDEVK